MLHLLHSFQNGGGPCYIVSVGSYKTEDGVRIEANKLAKGIAELAKEQEPTMVVVPEMVLLGKAESGNVHQAALQHCGTAMKNRIAILDVWEAYRERTSGPDCVSGFRAGLGIDNLSCGAAYYPWVNTTIVQDQDLSFLNFDDDSRKTLVTCIQEELQSLMSE